MLDKLNLPVCWRTRLEKSLVWTPFSAMRSLVPRLLLPKWPYRGSRTGSALLEVLAPLVRDATVLLSKRANFWEIWFYEYNFCLRSYKNLNFCRHIPTPFGTSTEVYGNLLVNHRNV